MTTTQKELKQRYIDITMQESWQGDEGMRKHFEKTIDRVVQTEKGYLIALDKPRIEKNFCFGYSDSRYDTEDYDRANDMADHARSSEEYFMRENMKQIDEKIASFKNDRYEVFTRVHYCNAPKDSVIHNYEFHRDWEVIEGTVPEACEPLGDADIQKLIEAYEEMKIAFEKRLKTYLKRYGLTQVRSWSYWQDR